MSAPDPIFSYSQPLADIAPEGLRVAFEAAPDDCAAMAKAAGLVGLTRLNAAFDLSHLAAGGILVSGTVDADVIQTCVVTLEPVENRVREPIAVRFLPPDQVAALNAANAQEDEEGTEAMPAEDVEPLMGVAIDLGRLAYEFMALGLDPYPRRAGAVFAAPIGDPADRDEAARNRPFAGLAGLRDKLKDRGEA